MKIRLLLILYSFPLFFATAGLSATDKKISLNERNVKKAIKNSTQFLQKSVLPNGMFRYRINMNPKVKVKESYNIIRHAGTIYAMGMAYQFKPNKRLRAAMKNAGQYIRDEAIAPVPGKNELFAVWSKPEVSKTKPYLQAALGGAGLGLVALLQIEKIEPSFTPKETLTKLAHFICFMQKEDGSFYSKYVPSKGGWDTEWTSLYYPGEAALGLVLLYENDSKEIWLESAIRTLVYLANERKNKTKVPADHWALLATAKVLSLKGLEEKKIPKDLLIQHAIQITRKILKSQIRSSDNPALIGGFENNGKTTPTATRLEGLLAVLTFLPPDHDLHQPIQEAARQGIHFLLNAQVQKGKFRGAFPRSIIKINKDQPKAKKQYRRATEVRIDYVQHALSAMIQYMEIEKNLP